MATPSPASLSPFNGPLTHLNSLPGVVYVVVSAPDGLHIAGGDPHDENIEMWSAVAAVLGKLSKKCLQSLAQETLGVAVFTMTNAHCIVVPISIGFLLVVVQTEAEVEHVCEQAHMIAQKLEAVMEGMHRDHALERNTHV